MELVYKNARIVTVNQIFLGSILVKNGIITAVDRGTGRIGSGAIDFSGDLLLPGLVELHTDNFEKTLQPRPGVVWPSMMAAALSHDVQIAGAGITTVFDAIAVGGWRSTSHRSGILADSLAAIKKINGDGYFRAEHFVHLCCELADEQMEALLAQHGSENRVRLLSMMDHTPGQRQWSDISKWRLYHREKKWTDEEADNINHQLLARQQRFAGKNRRMVVSFARQRGLPLASHDDTTADDCLESAEDGVTISEFPTTVTAAEAAKRFGMSVVMGAPNAVLGKSHSGNVSTGSMANLGLLDGLSSDYVPASLLHAVFLLADLYAIPLTATVAMVTLNNAQMAGLHDRGEIAVGKRADLIRVAKSDSLPIVRQVWRQGLQVC
jgi:alpha-D-ribose 1-methylphosphonate 5-triphosphate diphosphatase